MITVWTPAAYYAASRAARRAWQNTNDQLALEVDGLDERHASAGPDGQPAVKAAVSLVEPASSCPAHASPEAGGLTEGDAEPCRAVAQELTAVVPGAAPSCPSSGPVDGSASPLTTTGPGRSTPQVKRGRGQEVTV